MSSSYGDEDAKKRSLELLQVVDDYADFLVVDILTEKNQLEESVEDLLTKLEEFLNLLDLVRSDSMICLTKALPVIQAKQKQLMTQFQKIDKLEAFVKMARHNLELLEEQIVEAERSLVPTSPVMKIFRPLFSKKQSQKRPETDVNRLPVPVFHTEDFFKS